MQGLADGYFVIPYTMGHYLASTQLDKVTTDHEAFKASRADVSTRIDKLLRMKGSRTVDEFHRSLGKIMWEKVGMARNAKGLKEAIGEIQKLREEYSHDVHVTGEPTYKNEDLEKAGRVADFLELGELMALDALAREESCGGHFREEYQTPDNEAKRDDERFCFVSAWERGQEAKPNWTLEKETLAFEHVHLATRSYK